jgi:hypothetical protein
MNSDMHEEEDDVFDGWDGVRAIKSAQRFYENGRKWGSKTATTGEVIIGWIVLVAIAVLTIWAVLITR